MLEKNSLRDRVRFSLYRISLGTNVLDDLSTLLDRAVKTVERAGRKDRLPHAIERNLRVYRNAARLHRLTRQITVKDDLFSYRWHGKSHVVGV